MKHIYDIFDERKFLYQTIGGSLAMAFLGFLFVYFCLGCSKQHRHQPVCVHGKVFTEHEQTCSFQYDAIKGSALHCNKVKCKTCGQYLKK